MKKRFVKVCMLIAIGILCTQSMMLKPRAADAAPSADSAPAAKPAEKLASSSSKVETERKFHIDVSKLPADMEQRAKKYVITQTYINYSPEIRVRNINDKTYYFNLKRPLDETGLSREEIEFKIPVDEYETLRKKRVGSTIYKTRYQFYEGGTYVFVDVYSGKLEGLAVAEVEFKSVEESEKFEAPKWFGKDVTADKRYKNANLAKDGMPQSKVKSTSDSEEIKTK